MIFRFIVAYAIVALVASAPGIVLAVFAYAKTYAELIRHAESERSRR